MKRLALIDGDEVAFKACAVTAKAIDWGDGDPELAPDPGLAVKAARELVEAWSKAVEADDTTVCLSCRDRKLFRRELYPGYKAERTEKPAAYWAVVDDFRASVQCAEWPGLEADDVMGLLSAKRGDVQPIIVSSDKDMKTVPCWLFSPYHGTKKKIGQEMADRYWITQTLTGDPSDGYPGIPGVGPKKAEKILFGAATLRAMWDAVVRAYKDHAPSVGHLSAAITQARLARILRPGDYDFDKKEVKLWKP